MSGMIVDRVIKGVYALALAWVIVTVVQSKPWGGQPVRQQSIAQSETQTVPVPVPSPAAPAEIYDPALRAAVDRVRQWNPSQTAEWAVWCLASNDGQGYSAADQMICDALKLQ